MAHYYVYDTPGSLPVVPSSLPSLAGFDAVTADLTAPDGTTEAIPATLIDDAITVTLPLLDQIGAYVLTASVSGPGVSRSLEPARIPVEVRDGSGWHTIDSARRDWSGAPSDDARLFDLLEVARGQVIEYAPEVETVPANYRAGQLAQARNVWNATKTDPNANTYGPEGFTVTVFPLDWTVKQLLRPKRAVPVIA